MGGTISVEKGAVVKADIKANNVKISGEVKGNIFSTGNVHYMEDCSVTGNTTTSRILIEDGARSPRTHSYQKNYHMPTYHCIYMVYHPSILNTLRPALLAAYHNRR